MATSVKKSISKNLQPAAIYDNDEFFLSSGISNTFSNLVPPVDIIEAAADYEIRLSAPGLEPSNFTVEINDGVLTICADKEEQKRAHETRRVKKSLFVRSFVLPKRADESHIASFYNDGILQVKIPKMTFAS